MVTIVSPAQIATVHNCTPMISRRRSRMSAMTPAGTATSSIGSMPAACCRAISTSACGAPTTSHCAPTACIQLPMLTARVISHTARNAQNATAPRRTTSSPMLCRGLRTHDEEASTTSRDENNAPKCSVPGGRDHHRYRPLSGRASRVSRYRPAGSRPSLSVGGRRSCRYRRGVPHASLSGASREPRNVAVTRVIGPHSGAVTCTKAVESGRRRRWLLGSLLNLWRGPARL